MRQQITKAALLGEPRKRPVTDGHTPDFADLKQIAEEDGTVVPYFCTGCGMANGVNVLASKVLSSLAGTNADRSFRGKYFEVCRCIACSDDFQGATLKDLPN